MFEMYRSVLQAICLYVHLKYARQSHVTHDAKLCEITINEPQAPNSTHATHSAIEYKKNHTQHLMHKLYPLVSDLFIR